MKKKKKKPAAPKKAAKRATRGVVNKVKAKKKGPAAKPQKQKKAPKKAQKKAKPSPAKKTKPTGSASKGKPTGTNVLTPGICLSNFTAANAQGVNFQALPVPEVTITQVSGNSFPFTPVTGSNGDGMQYVTINSSTVLTVAVPAINKTYPFMVSVACPGLQGTHSITVDA